MLNSAISSIKNDISEHAVLAKINNLEVRLANTPIEVSQAIALRVVVFGNDYSINRDEFDDFCDHLIVVDNSLNGDSTTGKVVATYRLLSQKMAKEAGGFCTQKEYDIERLIAEKPNQNFLELGRSCVLEQFRNKRTLELLWAGTWKYVRNNNIDVMFGCASFEGTLPNEHRKAIHFLNQLTAKNSDWKVDAIVGLGSKAELLASDQIDPKKIIRNLPPLIKGYLRLGAVFSAEAVVDEKFGTTDILVMMPVSNLNPKYVNYYGVDADRHSAS